MGIQGLSKLIADKAPLAIRQNEIKNYFGRKVAIDASMSIYQFLIAVRQQDGQLLQNESGETTSHLMGLFYRTIRMVENGIKPVYVFDGKPPMLKSGELAKRTERRVEAQKSLDEAKEAGDTEAMDKFSRRLVKVSKQHNDECKTLLKLMGIPYVEAPCEAEAQCAALARAGKVFAAASEDMDTLTFNTPILMRHLTYSEAKKMPINEIDLDLALKQLELSLTEFIDLCILLGCDYTENIKGIGPIRAYNLIKEHRTIEKILENLDTNKYKVGENFLFKEARELFIKPEVLDCKDLELKWNLPNEEDLIKFLVENKGFNNDRVVKGIEKLKVNIKAASQSRLDSFFTITKNISANKRKETQSNVADKKKNNRRKK
ncbi:flap structure-specific endonuclease 1 [Neoconidiobolus thromboides FSU 785]|nr:flap structure-specific endonuclease 1 [Neoconidiobolus thromboides FSU 785]